MDDVSITTVMPAYNEGDRLAGFLQDWAALAATHTSPRVTALVVDDGSHAAEAAAQQQAVASAAARLDGGPHRVEYLRVPRNHGKGAAIRHGWSHADACATWLSFIDADGAVPASEYWRLAAALPTLPADIVCGARIEHAGRTLERSRFRRLQSRAFAAFVDALFQLGFHDTQCGVKFFRASLLRPLLPELREQRWLLDIEVLALMTQARARGIELPVDCRERGGSSVIFAIDPLRMARRLVLMKLRVRRRAKMSR